MIDGHKAGEGCYEIAKCFQVSTVDNVITKWPLTRTTGGQEKAPRDREKIARKTSRNVSEASGKILRTQMFKDTFMDAAFREDTSEESLSRSHSSPQHFIKEHLDEPNPDPGNQ